MTTTFDFLCPDGVYRTEFAFSTSNPTRFFHGEVPQGVVDIQVSIGDGPFVTSPDLFTLTGTSFTIPNPSAYPNGFPLYSGTNTFTARTLDVRGVPGPVGTITVNLVAEDGALFPPPTGLRVERGADSVRVSMRAPDDTRLRGINLYASLESGGAITGYQRVNAYPITDITNAVIETPLYTFSARAGVTGTSLRTIIVQEDATTQTSQDSNSTLDIPSGVSSLSYAMTISSRTTQREASFVHNRTAGPTDAPPTVTNGLFAALPANKPLYYVATAIYYDTTTGSEYESYFSPEVQGQPVAIRAATANLPAVSKQQILENAITSIYRTNPGIAVQPGSVLRDTVLDPMGSELERVRFLVDFFYRASSFDTLIAIDDPAGSGVSIAPATSGYKRALAQALYLSNVNDAQTIIDAAFEKLAANFGENREPAQRASGYVRFYTAATPTRSLPIPLGSVVGGRYRTLQNATLPVDRLAAFYNPITRVYSVRVPVEAIDAGSAGNSAPRQITTGAPFGFSVVNDEAISGGTERDSNATLAAKARGRLASVDPTTPAGYKRVATSVAGVTSVNVVTPGDPSMLRDMVDGAHRGGFVDVWIGGSRRTTVSDTFAFSYERRFGVQFQCVGNASSLRFQVVSDEVTPDKPISAMLNYPDQNLGLRNASTGRYYNLTGATILGYDTIALDTSLVQPMTALNDVILGDFRFRTSNTHVFSSQPVISVFSVIGESTGALDGSITQLTHPYSPMDRGGSARADDYLEILPGAGPTGLPIDVTDELHRMDGVSTESLNHLGADPMSLVVTDTLGTLTYRGPRDTTGSPDYTIVEGTTTAPLGIRRTSTSRIEDGGSVLISYLYDENFVVTYWTDSLPSQVQNRISVYRSNADVLAKSLVVVPVDISATVVLNRGADQSLTDTRIRQNLAYLFSRTRRDNPLYRSTILRTIDATEGVSHVVTPLTLCARAQGSTVSRESLSPFAVRMDQLSTGTVSLWIVGERLAYPPYERGHIAGMFSRVYENDIALTPCVGTLPVNPGEYRFIGAGGLSLLGYSDDATLTDAGFTTEGSRIAERTARTANRILIALRTGADPLTRTYWCTYGVSNATGDNDIITTAAEMVAPGSLTFIYEESRT